MIQTVCEEDISQHTFRHHQWFMPTLASLVVHAKPNVRHAAVILLEKIISEHPPSDHAVYCNMGYSRRALIHVIVLFQFMSHQRELLETLHEFITKWGLSDLESSPSVLTIINRLIPLGGNDKICSDLHMVIVETVLLLT